MVMLKNKNKASTGFTLVELSIVLIIIGLIIGTVTVGQELVDQARMTSFKRQLTKYDEAATMFALKYHYLPGDIIPAAAAEAGLLPRSGQSDAGDGNGKVGNYANWVYSENALFWRDLSDAGLIEEKFTGAIDGSNRYVETNDLDSYLPLARLPQIGNPYIHIWYSDTFLLNQYTPTNTTGTDATAGIQNYTYFTTKSAYMLDQKFDDGLPESGNIIAPSCSKNAGTPRTYNLNSTSNNCRLDFKANIFQ